MRYSWIAAAAFFLAGGNAFAQGAYGPGAQPVGTTPFIASGTTAPRDNTDRFGDIYSALDFGAKGDVVQFSDGVISAGTSTLSSASASCKATDVGKSLMLHRSGTAGAPQLGTISSCNENSFVVSFTTITNIPSAGNFLYGTDDTVAVASAVSTAGAAGKVVQFPKGAYGLFTQTASMLLNTVCLRGDPTVTHKTPYLDVGSVLLIFNQSTATFTVNFRWCLQDISFYWPQQDGYASSPITFPPLLEATGSSARGARGYLSNVTFINPYIFFQSDAATPGIGAIDGTDLRGYCIYSCFNFLGGSTANISLVNVSASPVYYATEATSGNAYLAKWTDANGEFLRLDVNAATVPSLTGLQLTAPFNYGYSIAYHIVSGLAAAWTISNFDTDGARTLLQSDNAARLTNSQFTGGRAWCVSAYDATVNTPCINGNSTGSGIDLSIIGTSFASSAGHVIFDATGTSFNHVVIANDNFSGWGQSSTALTYYAVNLPDLSRSIITGNHFICPTVAGNTINGVRVTSSPIAHIQDSHFDNCQVAVTVAPNATDRFLISGNTSKSTKGTAALSVGNATTVGMFVTDTGNSWDKSLPSTIATPFGTGDTIACANDWQSCTITVGTTPGTSGVFAYPWTQNAAPVCVANDNTTAVALTVNSSTTQVTIGGVVVAGDKINLLCRP